MATPRTWNRPGRPRKHAPIIRGDKPGPVPVPFLKNPIRYDVAMFNAAKESRRGGGHLLSMLKYGLRIEPDDVPAPVRQKAAAKCNAGSTTVFFSEPAGTLEGTIYNKAKRAPNSKASKHLKTVEGKERTYRKIIHDVESGDDDDEKKWLFCMTRAWLHPALLAIVFQIKSVGSFKEALKMSARQLAREVNEEDHAIEKILPAIDLAIPVE
jgi:hypothetical protein